MESITYLVRQLCRSAACSDCYASLEDCDVQLLRHGGNSLILGLTCLHCGTQDVVQLLFQGAAPSPVPVRDQPLVETPPITDDELLDLHQALAGHTGDFRGLLLPPADT